MNRFTFCTQLFLAAYFRFSTVHQRLVLSCQCLTLRGSSLWHAQQSRLRFLFCIDCLFVARTTAYSSTSPALIISFLLRAQLLTLLQLVLFHVHVRALLLFLLLLQCVASEVLSSDQRPCSICFCYFTFTYPLTAKVVVALQWYGHVSCPLGLAKTSCKAQ